MRSPLIFSAILAALALSGCGNRAVTALDPAAEVAAAPQCDLDADAAEWIGRWFKAWKLGDAFFVMAAPRFWAQAGVDSEEFGREWLITAVFLHEFAHTRQAARIQAALGPIEGAWAFPEELNDDVVQSRFQRDPEYVSAYEAERDTLYRAAAAESAGEARDLAIEALAGYAWLVHPDGGDVPPEAARVEMRRGGRKWAQDEGLALFLVVDRLLPDWPALVFGPKPIGATELLERAVSGGVAASSHD